MAEAIQGSSKSNHARFFNEHKQELDKVMESFQLNCVEKYRELRSVYKSPVDESGQQGAEDDALEQFGTRLMNARKALNRTKMKIAFFGLSKNGKSATINALLGKRIIPSFPGRTTECILEVKGSEDVGLHLYTNGVEHTNIQSMEELEDALLMEEFGSTTVLTIEYPKSMCPLLQEDVVFIDMPGLNSKPRFDEIAYKQCSDCDLFVAVVDAEKSFGRREKEFFASASRRISAFSILFAFNKWDRVLEGCSDRVEQLKNRVFKDDVEKERIYKYLLSYPDQVRAQHKDSVNSYLGKSGNARNQANCVFFYSAEKVLQSKLGGGQDLNLTLNEFNEFESALFECASKTARRNKIKQPCILALNIINDFRKTMIPMHLENLEHELMFWTNNMTDVLRSMNVEIQTAKKNMLDGIRKEIRDLGEKITELLKKSTYFTTTEDYSTEMISMHMSQLIGKFEKPDETNNDSTVDEVENGAVGGTSDSTVAQVANNPDPATTDSILTKIEKIFIQQLNDVFAQLADLVNNENVPKCVQKRMAQNGELLHPGGEMASSCKHCENGKRQCSLYAEKATLSGLNLSMNDICTGEILSQEFDNYMRCKKLVLLGRALSVHPDMGQLLLDGIVSISELFTTSSKFRQECLVTFVEDEWENITKESKLEKKVLKQFDDFSEKLKEASKLCLGVNSVKEIINEIESWISELMKVDESCCLCEEKLKEFERKLLQE